MAITFTELAAVASTANTNSYATGSISPGANRLVLVAVGLSDGGGADPDTPTSVTGNGITYELVDATEGNNLYLTGQTINYRVLLYRGMSASPSAGAVTVAFTNSATGCNIAVVEADGVDTSGTNGSGAIVQAKKNTAVGTALTVTLTSAPDAANAVYATYDYSNAVTFTPEGTWTELPATEITHANPGHGMGGQYIVGADQTAAGTIGSSAEIGGIAVEVAAAAAGGDVEVLPNTGVVTLAGVTPVVALVALPAAAVLSLIGNAATAALEALPSPGTLSLVGFAPTVSVETAPSPGVLTLVGFAPQLEGDVVVEPNTGTLTLAGFAPSVSVQSAPSTGILTASGLAPTATVEALPSPGIVTATGFAPTVSHETSAGIGTLTAVSFAPAVSTQSAAGVAVMTLSGFAPTITDFGTTVAVTVHFAPGSPRGGVGGGTPNSAMFGPPNPAQVRT